MARRVQCLVFSTLVLFAVSLAAQLQTVTYCGLGPWR